MAAVTRARGRARTGLGRIGPLAVMPAAAIAVHQLRYQLAFGGRAGLELARQGHSYLHSIAPWVVLTVAVAVGALLRSLGHALRGQRTLPRYTVSFAGLWLVCSTALVAMYAGQEFLEGLLATGHPAGLTGILGAGGWWAIPVAMAVGLVLAAGFHGASWVLREVTVWALRRRCARRALPRLPMTLSVIWAAQPAPLVDGWSGRGPPR